MAEGSVQIGRFYIRYDLTSLNRFPAAPREGHISQLVKIFGYLQIVSGMRKGGFHHLIHKTQQGVHKGTNMNERYSRLGWSLTAI